MKMAELEQRTGVNRETIRVLIRRGLLPQPEKPKPTVAHYTEDHVRGILAIRQLQQQYRMTLGQIGNVLQGQPLKQRVESTAFSHLEELVAAGAGVQDQLVSIDSLLDANPAAAIDAVAFEGLGMIERIVSPEGDMLSYTDARLIGIWGEMRRAGFDEAAGFHPSTLDHYMRASEYLAHAEAERFLDKTEGRIPQDEAATMLNIALPIMLDFFSLLRMKFFIRNIRRHRERPEGTEEPALPRPVLPKPKRSRRSPSEPG